MSAGPLQRSRPLCSMRDILREWSPAGVLRRGGQPNKFLHDLTPQISNDILGKVAYRAVSKPKIYCDLFVAESPQKDWKRLEKTGIDWNTWRAF